MSVVDNIHRFAAPIPTVASRDPDRIRIASDVEQFLAAGGQIESIPAFVCTGYMTDRERAANFRGQLADNVRAAKC